MEASADTALKKWAQLAGAFTVNLSDSIGGII